MAPSLVDLPPELLFMVCANLCYHCQSKCCGLRSLHIWDHRERLQEKLLGLEALRNLCLVSKLLCSVAQPILYHHLSPFYWDWRTRRCPLLIPFLRTIGQVPNLASGTKELDIRYILSVETKDRRLPALFRTLAPTLPGSKDWILDEDSASQLGNLLIKALLCSTPNLETACLGILPGWNFPLMAVEAHDKERLPLLSLKKLSLTGPAVLKCSSAFEGIDNLLASAPNLQVLRLQELTYYPPSCLLRKVRRLELCNVPISRTALKEMLRTCIDLEEFDYSGTSLDVGTRETGALGIEMVDALAPAIDSLRSLEISYTNYVPCIKNTHPEIASLKHFTKLERVNLSSGLGAVTMHKYPQYFAFGNQSFAEILPDSVQVFCPPCWPESILAINRHEFPNLRRIELEHGLSNVAAFSRSRAWTKTKATLKCALAAGGFDVSFAEDRDSSTFSR